MTPRDRARELLALALQDERAALALENATEIGDAIVGFHYQQATEKLLKALLADRNVDFPYTHDLTRLLALAEQAGYAIPVGRAELARLTPFAVTMRYQTTPKGVSLNRPATRQLVETLRLWVAESLRTEETP